jgi:purine-binding chemotaxis protein CheW
MSDPGKRSAAPADAHSVLRARARALARPEASGAPQETIELLEFRLARDHYALETRHVAEVLPLGELAPVPCTPAFVAGVVNVRGRITTVIDIQKFFGLPARGLVDLHDVILVRSGELELGLLADSIVGVRAELRSAIQPSLPTPTGVPAEYVNGMTADRLLVLDLDRMLADRRITVNEEVNP